jgi:hypothetical protein
MIDPSRRQTLTRALERDVPKWGAAMKASGAVAE